MKHKTPIILCDIDGTIALRGDRAPHDHQWAMEDAVNWPVVFAVDAIANTYKWKIVVISARAEKFRQITEYWLWVHKIFPDRAMLLMRGDEDNRPDPIVKRELYEQYIVTEHYVAMIFDDRARVVEMWRSLGLHCFQVAEGNY